MQAAAVLAIFVGGRSRRMGQPKGLLSAPGRDEPIVEALVRLAGESALEPALIGDAAPYGHLVHTVDRVDDDPPGGGPLAGLRAALRHARRKERAHVLAVACDMPFVSKEALVYLSEHRSNAPVVAPRRSTDAPWEPMLARYDAEQLADVLDTEIARGTRSFQALFSRVTVDPLPLTPAVVRALRDWDTPADLAP